LPQLPFNELIEELTRRGFVIGVSHHLRLQLLLNSLGADCAPSDLKSLLCPIFATNPKQQALFYQIFERYFEVLTPQAGKGLPLPEKREKVPEKSVRLSKVPYVLLGAILIFLIALFPLLRKPEPVQPVEKVTTTVQPSATTTVPPDAQKTPLPPDAEKTPLPPETQTTLPQPPDVKPVPTVPAPLPETPEPRQPVSWNWNAFFRTGALMMLTVFLLAELYLFSRRRLVLQRQGRKRPPFVWTIETPESDFLRTRQFYEMARVLRQRIKGEGSRLDVGRTVRKSLKAGFPVFEYKSVTRPPEYLFLIDLTAYRDHYAHFFDHVVNALVDEDLFATGYFYRENPRVCFHEPGGEQFYLSDLRGKFRDCRVILIGDCDDLLDPMTGELASWTSLFDAWKERAILTRERPRYWGLREKTLAEKFIVLPATLEGLTALPNYFENPSKLSLRKWKQADARTRGISEDKLNDIGALREYLGDDGFEWLCACAVYPELQLDLTLYLRQTSEVFKTSEVFLLKLIRLPWFQQGKLPDELRWKLIRELGDTRFEAIRERIGALFEENPPPGESFAYSAFGLNLALQQWTLSPKKFRDRRKLRRTLETVSESDMARNYTLLRFTESVPKSGVSLMLPERIRRVFYRNGVFVFGVKTGVRFAFTLFAVMLLFMVTRSDIKPVEPTDMTPEPGPTTTVMPAPVSVPEPVTRVTTTVMPEPTLVTTTTVKPETPEPEINNSIGMKLVYIPAGTFMMGSPADEPGRYGDETLHEVTLTKGFYMQTTEVTQGQWRAVMGSDPPELRFKDCGDNCPVERVSYEDVQEFIKKLNQMEKNGQIPVAHRGGVGICLSGRNGYAFFLWQMSVNRSGKL